MPDRLLSTAEVAAILGVTDRRVRQLAESRRVGRTVGKIHVFTHDDVAAMMDRPPGKPPQRRQA